MRRLAVFTLVGASVLLAGCGAGEPTLPEGQSLDFPKGKDYSAKKAQGARPSTPGPTTSPNMNPNDRKAAIDAYVREQRSKAGG